VALPGQRKRRLLGGEDAAAAEKMGETAAMAEVLVGAAGDSVAVAGLLAGTAGGLVALGEWRRRKRYGSGPVGVDSKLGGDGAG
jgi:hypothetical protein